MRETPSGFSFVCTYSIEYAVPSVASGGGARAEKAEQTKQSAPLKQGGRTLGGEDATTGFLLVFFFFFAERLFGRARSRPPLRKRAWVHRPLRQDAHLKKGTVFVYFFYFIFSSSVISRVYTDGHISIPTTFVIPVLERSGRPQSLLKA